MTTSASPLVHLLVLAIVICLIVWVVQQIPIPDPFKMIIWVLVLIIVLLALLPMLGVAI